MVTSNAVQNESTDTDRPKSSSSPVSDQSAASLVQLSDRERLLLRDAERIREIRKAYWEALTNGPKYEAVRLQDELRLAQHRMRERANAR